MAYFHKISGLSIVMLFMVASLLAQHSNSRDHWHYQASYLSSQDGLPQNSAYAMHQDAFGFVWIATQIGVARFDGHIFTDFPFKDLAGNSNESTNYERFLCETTVLAEDTFRHTLWIGSCAGLFGISTETYETWQFEPTAGMRILALEVSADSKLLLGTDKGLLQAEISAKDQRNGVVKRLFTEHLQHLRVSQIERAKGQLFIGTNDGVYVFEQTKTPVFAKHFSGGAVRALLLREKKDEIWIADSAFIHIYHLNKPGEIERIPQNGVNFMAVREGLAAPSFTQEIVLGTEYAGVVTANPTTYKLKAANAKDRFSLLGVLRGNQARSYLVTRDGVIWIGTRGMGITRLVLQMESFSHHFQPFQLKGRVPNNYVWAIWRSSQEDSIVWLGTEGNGLARYNVNQAAATAFYDVAAQPAQNIVKAISPGENKLWLGGQAGLHALNFAENPPQIQDLNYLFPTEIQPALASLLFDPQNKTLWIGTKSQGLFVYDTDRKQMSAIPTGEGQLITYIGKGSADSIVVASNRGYVQFPARPASEVVAIGHGPLYLENEHVKCVVPGHHPGQMWAGTIGDGLIALNRNTDGSIHIQSYLPENGLPDPVVYGILPAPASYHLSPQNKELWLSTNRGLSKFYPESSIFINYGEADNLQHAEFNTGAFFKTGSSYHFGGVNGFNIFDRTMPDLSPYLPRVALAYLLADTGGKDEKIILYDSEPNKPPGIQLKYNYPYIEFRILSLHYQDFGKVNYKYRLYQKGQAAPAWTLLQGEPNFTLSEGNGLHSTWFFPRHYYLEVWASNLMGGLGADENGMPASQQLRIHISVSPPYWQTWWFLLSLLLVGLVIVILAVNLKRQNSKLRIRNTDLQTAYNNTAALADLNEIGQKLVASLRLEENIGTIMEEIRDLRDLRSDVFAIDLLDEEGQMLESRLSIEDGKRLDSYAVSMDNVDSLGVACVKLALVGKGPNADGFIINDLADRGQYPFLKGEPGVQAGHPTRATLFVPMRVGTQVIGVITVQSYDPNVYSGYHLNMLQILGAYTAIAIDHSRASEARLRAERARTRAEQDDLIKSLDIKLLRSQLSPHFIFNSLGTIQYLVSEDDPRADDYTARLGEIMREVMMMITQSDVSLKTESDFLRRYVEAERIRFRNEYEFQWRMETAPSLTGLGVRIPPMLLQPFIENSLEHAFYPLPVGNHPEIRVYFGQKADQLVIVVQDNGVGLARHQNKKPATRPRKISTAMENIRRRADLINQLNQDKGCEMEIRSFDLSTVSPNKFTLVETWDLPLFEQGARFELHIPLSFKFSATTLND